jgi:hypothetical protein
MPEVGPAPAHGAKPTPVTNTNGMQKTTIAAEMNVVLIATYLVRRYTKVVIAAVTANHTNWYQ